jgi:hypothetical protein
MNKAHRRKLAALRASRTAYHEAGHLDGVVR